MAVRSRPVDTPFLLCALSAEHARKKKRHDSLNIMLLDRAPAHVAKRVTVPDNVILMWLPPYCPEFNPIERVWQDLKAKLNVVDQHVRDSLQGLRDYVAELVHHYTAFELASLTGQEKRELVEKLVLKAPVDTVDEGHGKAAKITVTYAFDGCTANHTDRRVHYTALWPLEDRL